MKTSEKNQPKVLALFSKQEISRLKASANYTYLIKYDGTRILSAYSLKVFQDLFKNKDFIRIDRSNLVNRTFIKSVNQCGSGASITLKDNTNIKLPRRKKERLKTLLSNIA